MNSEVEVLDIKSFITEIAVLPGTSGFEEGVGGYIAERFGEYCDEVHTDVMQNVIARLGDGRVKVMVSAHQDEVGMVVCKIEDDGSLRLHTYNGIDPRILPSMEVAVQAQGGAVFGVIGAKPPHLQTIEDKRKAIKSSDLFIDVGYPPEEVKRLIRVGDPVVMLAKSVELANGRMAAKTMDDRAGIAAMLAAAEYMKRMNADATTYFVSSSQEEVGGNGARTAAYGLYPDIAIAIDVTHGEGLGVEKHHAFPLDTVTVTAGPNVHPVLQKRAEACCKANGIKFAREVCAGVTGTDAGDTQVTRGGIPSLVLSIPLRYMHTSVETLMLDTVRETGRLIALFIDELSREWEGITWY